MFCVKCYSLCNMYRVTEAYKTFEGFTGGSVVENQPAMQEMQESCAPSPGQEDPLEEEMATHSVFLPGKSHGQRSLVDST